MKIYSRIGLLVLITVTIACSGAKQVSKNNTVSNSSGHPSWYSGFEFNSDSTNFSSRATAVAGDSETAKIRAEKEARALLESYIAKELEDIRSELERDGSTIVQKPDFILMLRNAHQKIENAAIVTNTEATQKEEVFRGFAKAEVGKQKVKTLLAQGFSQNSSYWKEYSDSKSFQEFLK